MKWLRDWSTDDLNRRQRKILGWGIVVMAGLMLFPAVRVVDGLTPSSQTPVLYQNTETEGIAFLFLVLEGGDILWARMLFVLGVVGALLIFLVKRAGKRPEKE